MRHVPVPPWILLALAALVVAFYLDPSGWQATRATASEAWAVAKRKRWFVLGCAVLLVGGIVLIEVCLV
jgi:cytochrome c oxidase assembly factor CtaG